MGLKEKQAIANLDFSYSEKRLKENTGKDIKIELDAESFSNDFDAIMYADSRGAEKTAAGIVNVCRNDIGKDAFNEKNVTKVVLKNQEPGSRSIKIENGILTVAFAFTSDEYFSDSEVRDIIENLL